MDTFVCKTISTSTQYRNPEVCVSAGSAENTVPIDNCKLGRNSLLILLPHKHSHRNECLRCDNTLANNLEKHVSNHRYNPCLASNERVHCPLSYHHTHVQSNLSYNSIKSNVTELKIAHRHKEDSIFYTDMEYQMRAQSNSCIQCQHIQVFFDYSRWVPVLSRIDIRKPGWWCCVASSSASQRVPSSFELYNKF